MIDRIRKAAGRGRVALAVLLSAAILLVLAWKTEVRLGAVWSELRRINLGIFAATLVFSAAWHVFLGADKWWRIMTALGAHVRYREVLWVRLASDPIRFAVPMKAGEVVNAAYFARLEELGFSRAAGSVVFDKSLNFFGTVFWLYVGIVAMAQVPPAGHVGLHTAMAVGVLLLFCIRPLRRAATTVAGWVHPKLPSLARTVAGWIPLKLRRLVAGVLSAFEEFSPLGKIGFLLYGILFQLRPLAVCWLLFFALEPDRVPSLDEFLALGSLVVLMSNIPSLGGIGPREATLVAVFSPYADKATLLSVGLLMSFSVQVLPALLGIPLMFSLLRAVTPDTKKEAPAAPAGASEMG